MTQKKKGTWRRRGIGSSSIIPSVLEARATTASVMQRWCDATYFGMPQHAGCDGLIWKTFGMMGKSVEGSWPFYRWLSLKVSIIIWKLESMCTSHRLSPASRRRSIWKPSESSRFSDALWEVVQFSGSTSTASSQPNWFASLWGHIAPIIYQLASWSVDLSPPKNHRCHKKSGNFKSSFLNQKETIF